MFTEERALWVYQHFKWLETHLPPRTDHDPRLVLPTPEFYPLRNTRDHAFAEGMFDRTKALMGMSNWPCRLASQSRANEEHADVMSRGGMYGETKSAGAAGTFSVRDNVLITYAPKLLADPIPLVATFAHELCHFLLAKVPAEPPCGWKQHKPLTDLAAVAEGFGVFLCYASFNFSQWTDYRYQGWKWSKQGYLNEAELAFALGVFCVRRAVDPDAAGPYLKLNAAEVFWDSIEYIRDLEKQTS